MKNHSHYLIRLLQEEATQAQAEVQKIQSSLRYRAGSLFLEALPPSRRSLSALRGLLKIFIAQARARPKGGAVSSIIVPDAALDADTLVLASSANAPGQAQYKTWVTTDAAQLAAVMDAVHTPGVVLLQRLDQIVLRRLARWQALGGRVDWHSLPDETHSPFLLGYLQSLLDKPLEPCL